VFECFERASLSFTNSDSDQSEDELISNERINENLTPENEDIYANAHISMGEFRLAFLLLQQRVSLKPHQARLVYDFIKSLLPRENNLTSYTKLISNVKCEKTKQTKACLICCKPLEANIECNNRNCLSQKKTSALAKYKDPICIKFDFHKHLQYILTDKYENIYTYQGKPFFLI
jgi:hypothetical protein